MNGRTGGMGTPILRANEPKTEPVKAVELGWTREQIDEHLSKYPAHKLQPYKREVDLSGRKLV